MSIFGIADVKSKARLVEKRVGEIMTELEAKDAELTTLRAKLAKAEEALEPFAAASKTFPSADGNKLIPFSYLHIARTTLAELRAEEGE